MIVATNRETKRTTTTVRKIRSAHVKCTCHPSLNRTGWHLRHVDKGVGGGGLD